MRQFVIDPAALNAAFGEVGPPKLLSSGFHCEIKTCPRCDNGRWKATVNLENGWFFCQVCQEKGVHIFALIPAAQQAVLRRRMETQAPPEKPVKTPLPPLPDESVCPLVSDLPDEHPAAQYLASRAVSKQLAGWKGIRWKNWGAPAWTKGTKLIFDSLQGMIYPIKRHGELVGWQFEAVPRVTASSLPKYCTAPGSELGSSFFNFDDVKDERSCVIVEGVFDALRLPYNAMAVLKDKISRRQVKLLSTCGFEEIILLLDSDRDEAHAAVELTKLRPLADHVRSVRLPQGDPADYHEDTLMQILELNTYVSPTMSARLARTRMSIQELAEAAEREWSEK